LPADFDFSSGHNLSKSEYVFYFHRLSKRGIYLILFNQFLKEMSQPYSIMPLFRPTKSGHLSEQLKKNEDSNMTTVHRLSKQLLQGKPDAFKEGEEGISRDNLTRATVDATGRKVLGAPPPAVSNALDALLKASVGKKRSIGEVNPDVIFEQDAELEVMTNKQLKALAASEKVVIKSKMNKAKLVHAILTARAAASSV
jgi:hypothetical protein